MDDENPSEPYKEVTVSSVDDLLISLTKRFFDIGVSGSFVYRGVRRAEWDIKSSLGRSPSLTSVLGLATTQRQVPLREAQAISTFVESARRLGAERPETDLVGWLAEMQHYGAPTRLVDWTLMPAVAAYFAYAEPDEDESNSTRCIWALNWGALHNFFEIPTKFSPAPVSIDRWNGSPRTAESEAALLRQAIEEGSGVPLPIRPLKPDRRMLAQHGVLTATTNESLSIDKKTIHSAIANRLCPSDPQPTLVKINLPSDRKSALARLRHLGFSRHRLFPDLQGLGADLAERMNSGIGDFDPLSFT